jgi:hypothetical protein
MSVWIIATRKSNTIAENLVRWVERREPREPHQFARNQMLVGLVHPTITTQCRPKHEKCRIFELRTSLDISDSGIRHFLATWCLRSYNRVFAMPRNPLSHKRFS